MNLTQLAKELVFQMTGKEVVDDCPLQCDTDFQIAYTYLWRVKSHYVSLEEERNLLKAQLDAVENQMSDEEIESVIVQIMQEEGPDGHVDGYEYIAAFVISLLYGNGKEWLTDFLNRNK